MERYTKLGQSPCGLRHFSQKMLAHNREFGGGYAMHVLESAADEMERLQSEIARLEKELANQQRTLF